MQNSSDLKAVNMELPVVRGTAKGAGRPLQNCPGLQARGQWNGLRRGHLYLSEQSTGLDKGAHAGASSKKGRGRLADNLGENTECKTRQKSPYGRHGIPAIKTKKAFPPPSPASYTYQCPSQAQERIKMHSNITHRMRDEAGVQS